MVLTDKLRRSVTLTVAALLFMASLVPLLTRHQLASAYGLVPNRSITLSSSKAFVSGDPNVTYHIKFDIATTASVGGIVVEFCDNTPIIGHTTCSAISGFDIGTPTVTGQSSGANTDAFGSTGTANISTLTTAAALTTHTLALTNGTAASLTSGQTAFFDITTVKNPDTSNHTFYARIMTYNTAANALAYNVATNNPGTGNIDAGGIAMSTANQITITSKVQERLTFCVYTDASLTPSNDCTSKSGSTINLGDTNGVLDSNGPYVDKTAFYGVTTNASGNAAIRVKGSTLKLSPACADTNGQNCNIDALRTAPAQSAAASEQFGFCSYQQAGSGLTVDFHYDGNGNIAGGGTGVCSNSSQSSGTGTTGGDGGGAGTTHPYFYLDNSGTGTASTYGQQFATKPAGTFSTGELVFLGNISNTTEPGIYSTTLTFIATGTY